MYHWLLQPHAYGVLPALQMELAVAANMEAARVAARAATRVAEVRAAARVAKVRAAEVRAAEVRSEVKMGSTLGSLVASRAGWTAAKWTQQIDGPFFVFVMKSTLTIAEQTGVRPKPAIVKVVTIAVAKAVAGSAMGASVVEALLVAILLATLAARGPARLAAPGAPTEPRLDSPVGSRAAGEAGRQRSATLAWPKRPGALRSRSRPPYYPPTRAAGRQLSNCSESSCRKCHPNGFS